MVSAIASLTGYAFLCGILFLAHSLGFRIRANDPVRKSVQRPRSREQFGPSPRRGSSWCKQLLTFAAGACVAGPFFVRFVSINAGGHLTHLEYFVINYGIWAAGGAFLFVLIFAAKLKVDLLGGSAVYPLIFFVGSEISMMIYYVLWQSNL